MPRQYTPRVQLTCVGCEQPFSLPPSMARTRRFCSQACRFPGTPEERFWSRVDKNGPIPDPQTYPGLGPCWIWKGWTTDDGRAWFTFDGRLRLAPSFAYIATYGAIPPESPYVTHLCDGGFIGCVRPSHLKADTQAGNMAGAVERGRTERGERHHNAKLTDADVLAIRAAYVPRKVTQQALADEYGVSDSVICEIVTGKAWRHL